jgi:hypothetical protein
MPESTNVYDMTVEIRISELISSRPLSTPSMIQEDSKHFRRIVSEIRMKHELYEGKMLDIAGSPAELEGTVIQREDSPSQDDSQEVELGTLHRSRSICLCLERSC